MIKQSEKASLETFSSAFYCKYAQFSMYHTMLYQKKLSDSIFVGLATEVDAPSVLAALRAYTPGNMCGDMKFRWI